MPTGDPYPNPDNFRFTSPSPEFGQVLARLDAITGKLDHVLSERVRHDAEDRLTADLTGFGESDPSAPVDRPLYEAALAEIKELREALDGACEDERELKRLRTDHARVVESLGFTGPMSTDGIVQSIAGLRRFLLGMSAALGYPAGEGGVPDEMIEQVEAECLKAFKRGSIINEICDAIGQPELTLDHPKLVRQVGSDRRLLNDLRHFLGLTKDAGREAVLRAIQGRQPTEPVIAELPGGWEWATSRLDGSWYARSRNASVWLNSRGDLDSIGPVPVPVVQAVLARHAGAPWVSRVGTGEDEHAPLIQSPEGYLVIDAKLDAPPEPKPTIEVDDTVEIRVGDQVEFTGSYVFGGPRPGSTHRVTAVPGDGIVPRADWIRVPWRDASWCFYLHEIRKVERTEEPVVMVDPPMDPSGWVSTEDHAIVGANQTCTTVHLHGLNWRLSRDGDGILLEQTEGGEFVLADPDGVEQAEYTRAVRAWLADTKPLPPEVRYPLWAIEITTPGRDPVISCIAGFETKAEAERDAANLLRDGNGVRLRRCRRLAVSERTDIPHLVEHILGLVLDEHDVQPANADILINPHDPEKPRVRLIGEAEREAELAAWLDRHLETDAWICEGGEGEER